MPIYGKNPSKVFSKIMRPITFELGIQHWGLGPYKVCSNNDPGLAVTYFTARSNLLPAVFVWEYAYILDVIETIEVYELKVGTNS